MNKNYFLKTYAFFALIAVMCLFNSIQAQTTYTWIGLDQADFQVAANWNPVRTTPATNDVLTFNDGTTKTITNLPATQTIGQFLISNNSSITLQSTVASTITISGGTNCFSIASGSSLSILQNPGATIAIILTLPTGSTGTVAGTMTLASAGTPAAQHHLYATDASAITFQNGSIFYSVTASQSFSGNPFGSTNLSSIIFASGSRYIYYGGSNPMGASAPNSVVVWQTGSTYTHRSTGSPSLSGRTYSNFEFDQAAGASNTSSSAVTFDSFTITNGNWPLGVKAAFTIKGNINIAAGATLNLNPTTAGTLAFPGTIAQSINNNGTLTINSFETFNVTNPANLVINNSATGTINNATSLPCTLNNSGTYALSTANTVLTGTINAKLLSGSTGGKVTAPAGTLDISGVTLNVLLNTGYTPVAGDKITLFTGPTSIIGTPTITWPAGTWHLDTSVAGTVSAVCDTGTGINPAYTNLEVSASNGTVSFTSEAGTSIEIYNTVGQKLLQKQAVSGLNTVPVSTKGVLFVKVGNRIAKVIL